MHIPLTLSPRPHPRAPATSRRRWLAAVLIVVFCAAAQPAAGADHHRFIYNADGDNLFIYQEPPMRPDDLDRYVDEIAGTAVTTLFISPNIGMTVNYPGRISEMLGRHVPPPLRARVRKGAATRRGSLERAAANLAALVDAGHDPLGLVIDRARKKGLEVFISFRLNEIHAVNQRESLLFSSFWRRHPAWRVGKQGAPVGPVYQEILGPRVSPIVASWFWGALDFAVPQVRAHRLAQLRECCQRYPIDGIDLDFQRFPVFFRPGRETQNVDTMTAWMRQVRQMTRAVGAQRGRPLLVSVRTLARPRQNLAIGLDPATWAAEGLIDLIVASHYLRNDYPLPIKAYRQIVPHGMPLYASIEVEPQPDTYRRIARRLWRDGVDGILLFNFFTPRESGKRPPWELLNELGNPATIQPIHAQAALP